MNFALVIEKKRRYDTHNNIISQNQSLTYHGSKKKHNNQYRRQNNPYNYPNYGYPPMPMPLTMTYPISMFPNQYEIISEDFYYKVSLEIQLFVNKVYENVEILNKYRKAKLNLVENLIKQGLEDICTFEIIYYGSFATNLSIESSDIDLLINYKELL